MAAIFVPDCPRPLRLLTNIRICSGLEVLCEFFLCLCGVPEARQVVWRHSMN